MSPTNCQRPHQHFLQAQQNERRTKQQATDAARVSSRRGTSIENLHYFLYNVFETVKPTNIQRLHQDNINMPIRDVQLVCSRAV